MNRTRLYAVNAISGYVRFAAGMGVLLVMTPFIMRHLGAQSFGLWTLTFAVVGFLGLMDCGFATGAVKFVAESRGRQDYDRRNRIVSTLLVCYLILAALAVVVIGVLSLFYSRAFGIPAGQREQAMALLWILALRNVILALPLGLFQGILFGEQLGWAANAAQLGGTLLYAGMSWAVLSGGGSVIALAWSNLAAMCIEYGAYVLLSRRLVPGLQVSVRLFDRSMLREVGSFSTAQMVVNVASLVRLRTDPIIVKLFMPLPAVAAYAVALRIAESLLLLTKQAINAMSPVAAELWGASDQSRIRVILVNASRFMFIASALPTMAVAALAGEILRRWIGPEYVWAGPSVGVLVIAMWLAVPQMVAANVLVVSGHHGFSARAQAVGMALNVAASVALAPVLGIVGVAMGTLVATVIVDLVWVTGRACTLFGIGRVDYVRRVLAPGLLAGGIQYGVTAWLRSAAAPTTLAGIALEGLAGAVVAAAIVLPLSMDAVDRALIGRVVARGRARGAGKVALAGE